MPHPFNVIPTILRYGSKIWAWPLHFYYTAARLEPFLIFDVPASGDPIDFHYHTQEAICYLNVYNLSPFEFTIDRIKVDAVIDSGANFSCTNLAPFVIQGSSHQRIFMRSQSSMTKESAERAKGGRKSRISIEAHIITPMCKFKVLRYIDQLTNVHVTI